ncbi:MAG: sulfotransferase [Woeseia sp.]
MTDLIPNLSRLARGAVEKQDWATVSSCANQIFQLDGSSPEAFFLNGLVLKAARKPGEATQAFAQALELDPNRYDAAIELANQHSLARRNAAAADLLSRYESSLSNSPLYLDMAGTIYTETGLPERAWPLYARANELQPGVDLFMANLAACGVYLGKIDEAREIYGTLLKRNPNHQRNHYHLARLEKARDERHVDQMLSVLQSNSLPDSRNIFLYYAIGKELEDLGRWQESFKYYRKGGQAVRSVAQYDIADDLAAIESVIENCDRNWLERGTAETPEHKAAVTPLFIVGLPRTGTTLVDRILSSHSSVQSLGETQFMQMVIRRVSGVDSPHRVSADIIRSAAAKDIRLIGQGYLDAVAYRLSDEPHFIDKLPYNVLFLGFIAKAFPHARIVHLHRNALDTCFAMYKQIFTWAYRFSYSLEDLGRYYVAYDRLRAHWQSVLGERIVEIGYETLVDNQERETRRLLDGLGLGFEQPCIDFDKNRTATTSASSVQVRQKIHAESVGRWKHFANELEPLRAYLESHGIDVR